MGHTAFAFNDIIKYFRIQYFLSLRDKADILGFLGSKENKE